MRTTNQTTEQQRREIEGWQAGLDALHARIAHRFRRAEVRERAKRYLVGCSGGWIGRMAGNWPNISGKPGRKECSGS